MDGRQRLGAVLLVIGLGLMALGGFGLMNGSSNSSVATTPTATPAATATLEPTELHGTEAPSPTALPTPTPTAPVVISPQLPPLDTDRVAAAQAFYVTLIAGIRSADAIALIEILHPATLERYGAVRCRGQLTGIIDLDFNVVVKSVAPPASWDYATDGKTTTIPDAWTVTAEFTSQGVTSTRELHIAPVDGELRWFTDCGTPLS